MFTSFEIIEGNDGALPNWAAASMSLQKAGQYQLMCFVEGFGTCPRMKLDLFGDSMVDRSHGIFQLTFLCFVRPVFAVFPDPILDDP